MLELKRIFFQVNRLREELASFVRGRPEDCNNHPQQEMWAHLSSASVSLHEAVHCMGYCPTGEGMTLVSPVPGPPTP